MLRFLGVRHLAVIDELEVEFEPGLNVLTGETGAGKSIVVEAIDLLVGARASSDLVRTGEDTALVQAVFERPGAPDLIVRREISSGGRSRAFLDDALATSAALRETGRMLIDLHGQHEHQSLLNPAEHLRWLDAFARHPEERGGSVAARFGDWQAAATALDRTRLDDREKRARIEMASFQIEEIDRINPEPGEDVRLQAEREVLASADRISRWAGEAYAALYEGDQTAIGALSLVWRRVADLATVDPEFLGHLEPRDEIRARLDELASALREAAARAEDAPARLQVVEDRLAALERLSKKHGGDLAAVLARRDALRDELAALGAGEERIAALEAAERTAREAFLREARELSETRRCAADRLSRALERALVELAMPGCVADARVTPVADPARWSPTGIDEVEFLLSPNPGEELRPLARIASGGELSRIGLAIRSLTVADEPGRTLVFDEVDAGIGGEAADAVGSRLQILGGLYQVICVTHLPQIAARADVHFRIVKEVRGGRTVTSVARLDEGGRVREIGRMIAGVDVSERVLASAGEMLVRRQAKGEQNTKGENRNAAHQTKAKGRGRRGA